MPTTQAPTGEKPRERVFLIDSMSHIFRAFFAPMANRAGPLATSTGQVTGAVYIFTNMLRKLLTDRETELHRRDFRVEVRRPFGTRHLRVTKPTVWPVPEELASQLPYIFRLCEALNIPIINAPGFEADDVIGTLARQIAEKDLQAVIVSNDKDMCQLVRDPNVGCACAQNSQVVKRKEFVPPIEWCDEGVGGEEVWRAGGQGCRSAGIDGRLNRQHTRRARNRFKGCGATHHPVWLN